MRIAAAEVVWPGTALVGDRLADANPGWPSLTNVASSLLDRHLVAVRVTTFIS